MGQFGGSLINSSANLAANAATNATNAAIANKQNEEAKRQFNENLDFLRYQYEDTKDYNSASAQRQRLIDAGYNPMFQGEQGSGSAAAVGSASPTASMSPWQVQAPQFDISKDMLNFASTGKITAETARQLSENDMFQMAKDAGFNEYKLSQNLIEQQVDNLKKQGRLFVSESELRAIQKETEKKVQEEKDANISYVKEQLKGIQWDNVHKDDFFALNQKEIESRVKANMSQVTANLAAAGASNEQAKLTREQREIAAYDKTLHQYGINPQDPPFTSLAAHIANGDVTADKAIGLVQQTMKLFQYKNQNAHKYGLAAESAHFYGRGEENRAAKLGLAQYYQIVEDTRKWNLGAGHIYDDIQDNDANLFNETGIVPTSPQ